jgi:hypothetical protein
MDARSREDVRIGEVHTDMVLTEEIGPLKPEDVKRLVALVLEQLRREQDRLAQRERDTEVRDRAYRGE